MVDLHRWLCEVAVRPDEDPARPHVDVEPHVVPVHGGTRQDVGAVSLAFWLNPPGPLPVLRQIIRARMDLLRHLRIALYEYRRRILESARRRVGEQQRDPAVTPRVEGLVRQADRSGQHEPLLLRLPQRYEGPGDRRTITGERGELAGAKVRENLLHLWRRGKPLTRRRAAVRSFFATSEHR